MSGQVTLLRQQLQQLARLHAEGALDDEAYRESRARLERRLVDTVMAEGGEAGVRAGPSSIKPMRLWSGVAALVVVAAAAGVLVWRSAAVEKVSGDVPAASASPHGSAGEVAAGAEIRGTVSLSPELAGRTRPDDTVFVFARAAGTAGMPLAVLRKQVKDLPFDFTLDDGMAMVPASRLSSVSQAVITARVSRSGDAIPQAGDLSGQSVAVPVGTTGLRVVIDTVHGH